MSFVGGGSDLAMNLRRKARVVFEARCDVVDVVLGKHRLDILPQLHGKWAEGALFGQQILGGAADRVLNQLLTEMGMSCFFSWGVPSKSASLSKKLLKFVY